MQTAGVEVRRLLDQIRVLSANPVIQRASDQLESICMAYMEPNQSQIGAALGLRCSDGAVFELLHKRRGQTVSRFSLLSVMDHRPDSDPDDGIVAVSICRLRKKLIGTKYEGSIQPVWGVGYKMELAA